ncbi:MAG TPA: TolC family protein [Terrimicrobiaceae bacterium]
MKKITTGLMLLALSGSSLRAEAFRKVQEEVSERTGVDVHWEKEMASRGQTSAIVQKLLKRPLTVPSAVQIALLNNRGLLVTFEEVGVAQADVIEAVTLPNPSVDFEVQFPLAAGTLNRYAWLVAQEFVQILMIPLKKKISEEQLEAVELRVAHEILDLVEKVKAAFFTVQAEQQLISRLKLIQETNAASLELAQKQYKAGNITDLALLQLQASYSQGRLDIAKAETDLRDKREELTRLLGLWGAQTAWQIQGDIMPIPDSELSVKGLESLAVAHRLDLRAAHRDLTSIVTALGLTKIYRWVPVLEFGFAGERDIEGALNMGPSFRLEIPIFNQGQSRLARAAAELRRAENRLAGLAVEIRSETRELRDRLISLRDMAKFYHDDLLPTRIKIVNKALLEYNAMQLSPYELFLAKSQEVEAERNYIDALRDYWITRAKLERTVGGKLTPRNPTSVADGKTTKKKP